MDGKYLVSSCLAGIPCRYDGKSCENEEIKEMVRQGRAIPVCPEVLGGLSVPRSPCEIVREYDGVKHIVSKDGRDCTREFLEGAEKVLDIAKSQKIIRAILKSKSPSCGCGLVYDGTFSGKLIEGNGITAEILMDHGIEVITENDLNHKD